MNPSLKQEHEQWFLDSLNREKEFRNNVLNNKSYPIWKQKSESKSINKIHLGLILALILGYI
jgi:hypothetical protein